MSTLLMATAAFCLTAGAAMAQTATSSPAPTGAPNAAKASPDSNASPGNMSPASGTTTTKPVYSGQNSIKTITTTSAPDASSAQAGMSNSSSGQMGSGTMAAAKPAPMHTAMTYYRPTALPVNADVRTYLKIAADAIKNHQKAMADDALSHAETRILTRAVPASAGAAPDDSPAISAIEHARSALASGDYQQAASDTRMAIHDRHGMMGGMGAMGGPAE
jgi:hypothetical protein